MKKASFIGLLIIGLLFQNCKNGKAEKDAINSKEIEEIVDQNIEIEKDSDTLIKVEDLVNSDNTVEEIIDNEKDIIKNEKLTKTEETNTSINTKSESIEETLKEEVVETVENNIPEIDTKNTEEIATEVVTETIDETIEVVSETTTETQPVIETPKEVHVDIETPKEVPTTSNKWVVPNKYLTIKNPTNTKEDLSIGKNLYSKHCKSCHGKEGNGDGTKAEEMNGDLGDFSSEEFQEQSDGALFYKSTFGRDDMPEYTKKMPDDEDRWLVVNYMRTLAE